MWSRAGRGDTGEVEGAVSGDGRRRGRAGQRTAVEGEQGDGRHEGGQGDGGGDRVGEEGGEEGIGTWRLAKFEPSRVNSK